MENGMNQQIVLVLIILSSNDGSCKSSHMQRLTYMLVFNARIHKVWT